MKKALLVVGILMSLTQSICGQDTNKGKNSYGILFMAGGRYDDYRY